MNVSSINSAAAAYQPTTKSTFKQSAQDLKALAGALQSGDLAGAQQAFSAWQNDRPQSTQAVSGTSKSSSQGNPIGNDFQALQSALQSGDLGSAQSAFATLKQDMQSAGGLHRGHHHHHRDDAAATNSSTSGASATTASDKSTLDSLLNIQA